MFRYQTDRLKRMVTKLQKTAFSLVKSRLALGSPGCLVVWLLLFVTMPKMAEYAEK